MGIVTIRTSLTSEGILGLTPYNGEGSSSIYAYKSMTTGNNSNGSLEVVSALNLSNLARYLYHYNQRVFQEKYNPKVYMGTVQSVAFAWQIDTQTPGSNAAADPQKSGSWPRV